MIIMMHGLPVSGKSYLAEKMRSALEARGIRAEIVKSVATRDPNSTKKFTIESIDERVEKTRKEKDDSYRKLLELAEEKLNAGIVPILDATFHKRYRRMWAYRLARKLKEDLVVVSCVFDDEDDIGKILRDRAGTSDKDAILDSNEMRILMKEQADPLDNDETAKLIVFDRKKGVKAGFEDEFVDVVRGLWQNT
ncbi:MAG: AAA family ATPase [Nanoarchaeota archaeon]